MTKQEINNLFNSLLECGNLSGAKFSYAIARNINILKDEIKSFNEDRVALAKSYSKKDEKGEAVMKMGQDDLGRPAEVFDLNDQKGFEEEFKKLQKEELDIKLFKIDFTDIPQPITVSQMAGIYQIVNEEEKPKVESVLPKVIKNNKR